jgi:hypothetical protein
MLGDLEKAKIVITNYHAFQLRDRMNLSKGGRSLLQGRGAAPDMLETEGQMIQRVMPGLMGLKNIMVINGEAHHCYREALTSLSKLPMGFASQTPPRQSPAIYGGPSLNLLLTNYGTMKRPGRRKTKKPLGSGSAALRW